VVGVSLFLSLHHRRKVKEYLLGGRCADRILKECDCRRRVARKSLPSPRLKRSTRRGSKKLEKGRRGIGDKWEKSPTLEITTIRNQRRYWVGVVFTRALSSNREEGILNLGEKRRGSNWDLSRKKNDYSTESRRLEGCRCTPVVMETKE